MNARLLAVALTMLLLAGALVTSAHDGERLGSVHFPVSCAPAVQGDFERAVALLHSFWYEEAEKAFTTITTNDSGCAMGPSGSGTGIIGCHSVAIALVFCGPFCPRVSSAPGSATPREMREVAEKSVVAPTGFEPVFGHGHAFAAFPSYLVS